MNESNPSSQIAGPRRPAWNKGKLAGSKPPLRLGHVWSSGVGATSTMSVWSRTSGCPGLRPARPQSW